MIQFRALALAALAASFLATSPSVAAPADTTGTSYALVTPPSSFEVGCQGPCAVHGFACFDSVLVVNAAPSEPVGVIPPPSPRAGLQAVRPNPFSGKTRISFALDRPGRASLTIVDLGGRLVRALAAERVVGS